jgi:hypothetical protein
MISNQGTETNHCPSDNINWEKLHHTLSCLKHFEEKPILKRKWMGLHKCKTWFHVVCIDGQDTIKFICGKRI